MDTHKLVEVDNMTWNERDLGTGSLESLEEQKAWREKNIVNRYSYRIEPNED